MIYKIKKYILGLILVVFSVIAFAQLPEAPNTLITENPEKEVTTVDAPKNREHAEMNITVNKILIKEKEGISLSDGRAIVFLNDENEEEKINLAEDEVFYVTDSLENFPDISTVNGKRTISNLKRVKESAVGNGVIVKDYGDFLLLEGKNLKASLYMGAVNKKDGTVSKMWKIEESKNYKVKELIGIREDSSKVDFDISTEKELKSGLENNRVKFYRTNNSILRRKRSLNSNNFSTEVKYKYTPRMYSSARGFTIDYLEVEATTGNEDILMLDKNSNLLWKVEKVVNMRDIIDDGNNDSTQYANVRKDNIVRVSEEGGKYYIWIGNYREANRSTGGSSEYGGYNFSITNASKTIETTFEFSNTSSNTNSGSIQYGLFMDTNPKVKIIGNTEGDVLDRDSWIGSHYRVLPGFTPVDRILPSLAEYNLVWPKSLQTNPKDSLYGWCLAMKIRYEIPADLYNEIMIGKYNYLKNIKAVKVFTRKWFTDPSVDTSTEREIISVGEMQAKILPYLEDEFDFANKYSDEKREITSKSFSDTSKYFTIEDNSKIEIKDASGSSVTKNISDLKTTPLEIFNGVELSVVQENSRNTFKVKKLEKSYINERKIMSIYDPTGVLRYEYGLMVTDLGNSGNGSATINLNSPVYHKFSIKEGKEATTLEKEDSVGSDSQTVGNLSGTVGSLSSILTGRLRFSGSNPKPNSADDVSTSSLWKGPRYTGANIEANLSFNGESNTKKIYLELLNWNGNAETLNVNFNSPIYGQSLKLLIPAFDGKIYLNRDNVTSGVNYDEGTYTVSLSDYTSGNLGNFDINLKDYSIKAVARQSDNLASKFALRVPKTIVLKMTDSADRIIDRTIKITATDKSGTGKNKYVQDDKYYYFYPTGDTSSMSINVALSGDLIVKENTLRTMAARNSIEKLTLTLNGTNLGLVTIGIVDDSNNFTASTNIIDNVDISIGNEVKKEEITFITESVGATKTSTNKFSGVNENLLLEIAGESVTASTVLNDGYIIPSSGIKVTYDRENEKFVFTKVGNTGYSKDISIGIHSGGVEGGPIVKEIKYTLKNTKTHEVTVKLANPVVGAKMPGATSYGAFTIADGNSAYYLDGSGDRIDSSKYEQFKLEVSGSVAPYETTDKIIIYKPNNTQEEISVSNDDNVISLVEIKGTNANLKVDFQKRKGKVEGLDVYLEEWNLAAETITFSVYYNNTLNKYNIVIPQYDGTVYFNNENSNGLIDLNEKILKEVEKEIINIGAGTVLTEVDIGTKDYDIGIFGSGSGGRGELGLTIPKKITAQVDNKNLNIETEIVKKLKECTIESDNENWHIYPKTPNNNLEEDNYLDIKLKLKISANNENIRRKARSVSTTTISRIEYTGSLISINAFTKNKQTPIVEKYLLTTENENYTEEFNMEDEVKGVKKEGINTVTISDEDYLEIYNQKDELKGVMYGSELKNTGWTMENTGLLLGYNGDTKKLSVTKIDGVKVSEVYKIKVKTSVIPIREIEISVKNDLTFAIVEGSKLDFGDFFAGDIKFAEALIKFTNPREANVSIALESETGEMTKVGATSPSQNQRVQLDSFWIREFDKTNPKEHSFKLGGRAVTTNSTEAGNYRGKIEVIITVHPKQ